VALRGAFRLKSVQDVAEGLVEADPPLAEVDRVPQETA